MNIAQLSISGKSKIIIFIIVFANSCAKDDINKYRLPPITSEGKGTFGCRINDNIFLPTGEEGRISAYYYTWKHSREFYGTFRITTVRSSEQDSYEYCQVYHPAIFKTGTYELSSTDSLGNGMCNVDNKYYEMKPFGGSGKLTIHRYDTIARIISGTFYFTARNTDLKTDTAFVTDGRFDVKF